MARRKKRKVIEQGRVVPVKRYNSAGITIQYADDVVLQHTEQVFYLTFSQMQRPIILGEAEASQIKEVRCECVARLVVTPEQMKLIIDAFNKNFEKYVAKYGEIEAEEPDIETMNADTDAVSGIEGDEIKRNSMESE